MNPPNENPKNPPAEDAFVPEPPAPENPNPGTDKKQNQKNPSPDDIDIVDYGGSPFGGSTKVHPEATNLW